MPWNRIFVVTALRFTAAHMNAVLLICVQFVNGALFLAISFFVLQSSSFMLFLCFAHALITNRILPPLVGLMFIVLTDIVLLLVWFLFALLSFFSRLSALTLYFLCVYFSLVLQSTRDKKKNGFKEFLVRFVEISFHSFCLRSSLTTTVSIEIWNGWTRKWNHEPCKRAYVNWK